MFHDAWRDIFFSGTKSINFGCPSVKIWENSQQADTVLRTEYYNLPVDHSKSIESICCSMNLTFLSFSAYRSWSWMQISLSIWRLPVPFVYIKCIFLKEMVSLYNKPQSSHFTRAYCMASSVSLQLPESMFKGYLQVSSISISKVAAQ